MTQIILEDEEVGFFDHNFGEVVSVEMIDGKYTVKINEEHKEKVEIMFYEQK